MGKCCALRGRSGVCSAELVLPAGPSAARSCDICERVTALRNPTTTVLRFLRRWGRLGWWAGCSVEALDAEEVLVMRQKILARHGRGGDQDSDLTEASNAVRASTSTHSTPLPSVHGMQAGGMLDRTRVDSKVGVCLGSCAFLKRRPGPDGTMLGSLICQNTMELPDIDNCLGD